MTTPLPELFAQVPALKDPREPFTYEVIGNTITGRWDIVHASFVEWKNGGTIDEDYVIVVDFNEGKGTFDFQETKRESESAVTVDGGTIGFGTKKKTFVGKSSSKSFSFRSGGVFNTPEGSSGALTYEFETKRIKQPLFDFLEQAGWKRKKGFLGDLFG